MLTGDHSSATSFKQEDCSASLSPHSPYRPATLSEFQSCTSTTRLCGLLSRIQRITKILSMEKPKPSLCLSFSTDKSSSTRIHLVANSNRQREASIFISAKRGCLADDCPLTVKYSLAVLNQNDEVIPLPTLDRAHQTKTRTASKALQHVRHSRPHHLARPWLPRPVLLARSCLSIPGSGRFSSIALSCFCQDLSITMDDIQELAAYPEEPPPPIVGQGWGFGRFMTMDLLADPHAGGCTSLSNIV